ncbi:MAG: hypothetical protein RL662_1984 [Bacteroidota bacterium]|jgi:hypothetical protein
MNYTNQLYRTILFISIITSLSACKAKKEIVSNNGSVIKKSQNQLIDDILETELKYTTISGKVLVELIPAGKTSGMKVNSRLKIKKDDIIQLSILAPFINTEVIRLNITPDSVFLIDRMAKKYAAEDIKKLEKEKNIQFNYNNMQALFTNTLFVPGKKQITKTDYNSFVVEINSEKNEIRTKDKANILYNFIIDANDRIIATNIASEKNANYSMNWSYEDFIKDAQHIYPTKMTTRIEIQKKQATLVMNYGKLDIDTSIDIDKGMPSKYERTSMMDILKNYIK